MEFAGLHDGDSMQDWAEIVGRDRIHDEFMGGIKATINSTFKKGVENIFFVSTMNQG